MDAEQHEEIARCLFREANDALFLFDPGDHRVVDVNPAALRLTGFDKDEVCALRVGDLFAGAAPGDLERLTEAYRRTGFFHSREGFVLSRSAGEPIPVNISVSRIHTAPAPLGLVVARDISERLRAQEALRESERRYRTLVESARVVVWTLAAGGRVTSLNPAFQAITGRDPAASLGKPLADLLHPDDRPVLADLLGRALRGEPTPAAVLRVRSAADDDCHLELISLTRLPEGQESVVSGIARDVTERLRAEEALRQAEAMRRAKEAAERADRAKTEFLANVSHEIRTPMTAILGFTDVLMADERVRSLPPQRLDDLRTIQQNGAHLLALINDILDLSKIEAGRLPVTPVPSSPAQVAAEVVASMRVRAEAKGLPLSLQFLGPLPATIRSDPVRLRQILSNLLGNAIKFTERGGVWLRVGLVDPASPAPALRFEVEDSGVGLSPQELAGLFEPFSRARHSPSGEPNGSGLGLAISRRLAERLGGRIDVASTPGRGSRFTLTLPTGPLEGVELRLPPADAPARAEPSPPPAPAPPTAGRLRDARILLAEDNPAIQRIVALHLERAGAAVVPARNGQEALDLALSARDAGRPFDAILMDMQMPVLDGYEATRQLRASGFRGAILALTAYAMPEDREECLRFGCDDHVSKPIDWEQLLSKLADHLGRRPDRGVPAVAGA
jgi:PAS domain S-box-containing protein